MNRLFHAAATLCLLLSLPSTSYSQCTVTGPKTTCLGNLSSFSVSVSSGNTFQSGTWKFGDSYTALGNNTGHLYKQAGIYTVSCKVTLSSGTTCLDSIQTEILALPQAALSSNGSDNYCQFSNNICFTDMSAPAAGNRPITKRIIVWGDGAYNTSSTPSADNIVCHHFATPDKYRVKVEVTDKAGCKNTTVKDVTILEGTQAVIDPETDYPDCGQARVCFKNHSEPPANNYRWVINNLSPVNADVTYQPCITVSGKSVVKALIIAELSNGCKDTARFSIPLDADTISATMTINHNRSCYGSGDSIIVQVDTGSSVQREWYVNDSLYPDKGNRFIILPKQQKLMPGTYTVTCHIRKGKCHKILTESFTVAGPVASIKIYNGIQCGPKGKVFFVDETALTDKRRASWYWAITDEYGDTCTAERAKNINKYSNCNYSTDWYHKHQYSAQRNYNPFTFSVYDSVTQCGDMIAGNVYMDACFFLEMGEPFEICQGGKFLDIRGDISIKPVSFSMDTGKTWLKFPSKLNPKYVGWYGLKMVFPANDPDYATDYGDDSFQVIVDTPARYDTLFIDNILLIHKIPNPAASVLLSKTSCIHTDAIINLKEPVMLPGERLQIYWGDSTFYDYTATDTITRDSLRHRYRNRNMKGHIAIYRSNVLGCSDTAILDVGFGLDVNVNMANITCYNQPSCFNISVKNIGTGKYWDNTNAGGNITIDYGDSISTPYRYSPLCHIYKTPGYKITHIYLEDSSGCKDTLIQKILIERIIAGVTNESKDFGCNELKQLFDSSALIPNVTGDGISDYLWDYGSGTFSTRERDPLHTFETGGTYTITHVVRSISGCTDTVRFSVKVLGSEPRFYLPFDTVGCVPFKATFRNTSINGASFIWEFGDPNNITYITSNKDDVTFTYDKAGTFDISLTAIDTFYNIQTGSIYYCHSTYPPQGKHISVTALPTVDADFMTVDHSCEGSVVEFMTLSDQQYQTDHWDFGDHTTSQNPSQYGRKVSHTYTRPGRYTVSLAPDFTVSSGPKCLDTARRSILIGGIHADFNYTNKCLQSSYEFINLSVPESQTSLWKFFKNDTLHSYWNNKNLSYNFTSDTGNYKVVLYVSDSLGCTDSTIQYFHHRMYTPMRVPNIFTPGAQDGKNDVFDIDIDGETLYDLIIYDRWGIEIFHSDTDDVNWNGDTRSGNPCSAGTYYFLLKYGFCNDQSTYKSISGNIMLIR